MRLTTPVPGNRSDTPTPRLPRRIRHAGPCGQRVPCPAHGSLGVYLPAERLRNGTIVAHDCGRSWRPHELARAA